MGVLFPEKKSETARNEFRERFKAHMLKIISPRTHFDDDEDGPGESIAEYADEVADAYFDEEWQRKDGPEACADADVSYWGE